jgi:hypothetical protein
MRRRNNHDDTKKLEIDMEEDKIGTGVKNLKWRKLRK